VHGQALQTGHRLDPLSRVWSCMGVGRQHGLSPQNRVLRAAKCRRPIVRTPARDPRPFVKPISSPGSLPAWVRSVGFGVSCSPGLSGYRGMRDAEAAKAVGFTVHAGYNLCNFGDTCKGQRDPITNLTQAMSDMFQVEFHAPTSKAKAPAAFLQEVRLRVAQVD